MLTDDVMVTRPWTLSMVLMYAVSFRAKWGSRVLIMKYGVTICNKLQGEMGEVDPEALC